MRPRSVPVRLFVSAKRKFRDMGDQGIIAQFQHDVFSARPSFLPGLERKASYIGNEVGAPSSFRHRGSLAGEEVSIAIKAIGKPKIVIKHKIVVMKIIYQQRRGRYRIKSGGFRAGSIIKLMESVGRNKKQTSFLPFECLFFFFFMPNSGRASSF